MPRRFHLPGAFGALLCQRQLSKLTPTSQGNTTMRVLDEHGGHAGKAVDPAQICRHCLREAALLPPVGEEPPSGEGLEGEGEDEG